MGIFEGAARNDAARRAIALGQRQPLPLSIRSLTAGEVARRHRGPLPTLAMVAVAALLLGAFALSGADASSMFAIGLPTAFLAGFILHRMRRTRQRRHPGYADPLIVVAVGEGGVRVEGPGGAHEIAFAEARFDLALGWHHRSFRSSTADFLGIALNSPLGRLAIDDARFRGGRRAAAAICARCAAVGRRHGG